MGETANSTATSSGQRSSTPYAALTLAQLRDKAKLDANPNDYSSRSWLQNAQQTAEQAKQDDAEGLYEQAFVRYLKACQFFQAFLDHKEYAKIKAEGSKNVAWFPYMEFSQKRPEYLSRARALSDVLKQRPVEQQAAAKDTPQPPPTPVPSTSIPSTPTSQEPDTSSGGSIAARLAALKGAGMQVGVSTKRTSRDMGHSQPTTPASANTFSSQYATANNQTPLSSGNGSAPLTTNGTTESRRGSVASLTLQPVQGPPSRRGSIASQNGAVGTQTTGGSNPPPTPKVDSGSYLDSNKTGSSINSIRSFDRFQQQQQQQPSSSNVPQSYGTASPLSTSSTRALPTLPSQGFKSPLPSMSFTSGSNSPSTSNPSSTATRPLRQNSNSAVGGYGASGKPEVIQEDEEMAHFSTVFPSLTEFEGKPEFVPPPSHMQDGVRPLRKGSLGQDGLGLPREDSGMTSMFPSAPSTVPGERRRDSLGAPPSSTLPVIELSDSPPRSSDVTPASNGKSSSPHELLSGLSVADPVQRPSSLPMPDSASTPLRDKSYFPSPPLPSDLRSSPPQLLPSEMPLSVGFRTKPPLPPIPKAKPKALSTQKPTLPFTNSILAEVLFGYLQEPLLSLLVIDTRPLEEHQQGFIGKDMDLGEGRSVNAIWVDPTILSRPGLDSIKLENALSLLPSAEHKAFLDRQRNDLVVIYDSSSTAFPKPGAPPTAPGTLFSLIFENEFRKSLPRSPVLLVGGYQAWKEEMERRARRQRNGETNGGSTAVTKGPPPVIASTKPTLPLTPGTADVLDSRASRRDTGVYRSSGYSRNITDNFNAPYPQSMVGMNHQAYNGQPMIPNSTVSSSLRHNQPSAYASNPYTSAAPTPPPLASTSPGPLSRKRSDYVDQHNKPYSGYQGHTSRPSMDYPQINHHSIPQPPPAAATSSSERQESRPRADRSASIISFDGLSRLPESDDMMYWNDVALGISGLKNLGNTCYMNSTLQCLSATYPLARFFRDGSFKKAINTVNPMGTKGDLAKAFATLISVLWNEQYTFLSPVTFRKSISTYAPSFAGTDQHDSQEFLSFLLDGLHEDLNRIRTKPPPVEMTPEREAALETLPPSVAAEKEWQIYKQRNDSLIVDLFQGQYRNRMECLTCHKTSTTYDAFMYLSLPVPQGKQKVVLYELIDNFVQTEVMENDDAWNCPRCKVPRKATKSLSIARLPPVLLIHLKRFTTANGVFWDKSETPVIFPIKHLDLTRYIPPSPAQIEGKNPSGPASPTSTTGPFLYDLFAISNHMGSLSNGHYTAFVNSSKGWKYCDDSKITPASERDVVNKPAHAYILWYKRTLPPRTKAATAA